MDVVRKGNSVIKRISLLMVAALMAAMMMVATAAPAFAASSEQTCTENGGEFTRTNGTASCKYDPVDVPAKNSGQEKFQKETQTTETGQGNLDNKDDDTTTPTCGKPCPPGQFPK